MSYATQKKYEQAEAFKDIKPDAAPLPRPISPIIDRDVIERDEVSIIAVVRADKTWTAIRSDEFTDFHQILAYGESLPENVACFHFPKIAQRGLEYRL